MNCFAFLLCVDIAQSEGYFAKQFDAKMAIRATHRSKCNRIVCKLAAAARIDGSR